MGYCSYFPNCYTGCTEWRTHGRPRSACWLGESIQERKAREEREYLELRQKEINRKKEELAVRIALLEREENTDVYELERLRQQYRMLTYGVR